MKTWPAMIFVLLGLNALIVGATLYFSFGGAGAGVEPSYDHSGESYSQVQAREQRNARLAWDVSLSADRADEHNVIISVRAIDAAGEPIIDALVEVDAFHALATRDKVHAVLPMARPGVYSATLSISRSGPWLARLRVARGEGDTARLFDTQRKFAVRAP